MENKLPKYQSSMNSDQEEYAKVGDNFSSLEDCQNNKIPFRFYIYINVLDFICMVGECISINIRNGKLGIDLLSLLTIKGEGGGC